MPYHIGEQGSHGCKGFPVVKTSDGTVMGCHKTKEHAKKQLAALYANEPEASKEKAMAMDYATSYANIVKYDKNDDGTLMVFGKATDDTLDLDSQICDPAWLDTAMPQWFKSGGNIREMHGPSAAGVAKEYEAKADGHYIGVHVVDPVAVKKVEAKVYQGFSIGIKSPRVVRDQKAANGRIIDGQIIEVSLVDRPANPSAKLILAKSVEGESSLVQVEELHEYKAPLPSEVFKYNENHDEHGRFAEGDGSGGGSSDSGLANHIATARDTVKENADKLREAGKAGDAKAQEAAKNMDKAGKELDKAHEQASKGNDSTAQMHVENAHQQALYASSSARASSNPAVQSMASQLTSHTNALANSNYRFGKSLNAEKGSKMETIKQITELAKSLTSDAVKFDATAYNKARAAIAELLVVEANEMKDGHDERMSLRHLLEAVEHLLAWYEGEEAEGEVPGEEEEIMEMEKSASDAGDTEREEAVGEKCDKCNKAMDDCDCADKEATADEEDAEKTVEADAPAVEETPAVVEEVAPVATEEVSEAPVASDNKDIETLVEEAVKSAMASVKDKMDSLVAEKESALEKSMKLETELATALSKAVAGGPKRTSNAVGGVSNEYLVKAATYKAKADATTDPVLAKGYRELANEFFAKAEPKKQD